MWISWWLTNFAAETWTDHFQCHKKTEIRGEMIEVEERKGIYNGSKNAQHKDDKLDKETDDKKARKSFFWNPSERW